MSDQLPLKLVERDRLLDARVVHLSKTMSKSDLEVPFSVTRPPAYLASTPVAAITELDGIPIPADVSVFVSQFGAYTFIFAGHKAHIDTRFGGFSVPWILWGDRHSSLQANHFPSRAAATTHILARIDRFREEGMRLRHRAGGTEITYDGRNWELATSPGVERGLIQAHHMFIEIARQLYGVQHILERNELALDELLVPLALCADNLPRMRCTVTHVASVLKSHADLLSWVAAERATGMHRSFLSDRPTLNLERDASWLRRGAGAIVRNSALDASPGDFRIQFSNGTGSPVRDGSVNHSHVRSDLTEARQLAWDYRPYNNTRATIRQIESIHIDGERTHEIRLRPEKSSAANGLPDATIGAACVAGSAQRGHTPEDVAVDTPVDLAAAVASASQPPTAFIDSQTDLNIDTRGPVEPSSDTDPEAALGG